MCSPVGKNQPFSPGPEITSQVASAPQTPSVSSLAETKRSSPLPLPVKPAFFDMSVKRIQRHPLPEISSSVPLPAEEVKNTPTVNKEDILMPLLPRFTEHAHIYKHIINYYYGHTEALIFSIKEMMKINPPKAYEDLANAIANREMDLVAFNITAKDIVGLAQYPEILRNATFNHGLLGTNVNFPGAADYNKILIEILHFADLDHMLKNKRDLHLLGNASDKTIQLITFQFDSIPAECYAELSRIEICYDVGRVKYCPDLTMVLGRASKILEPPSRIDPSYLTDDAHNSLRGLSSLIENPEKLADMFTQDSVCALPHLGLAKTESSLFYDILKHLLKKSFLEGVSPEKKRIAERVLINTYREHSENNRNFHGKGYFMKIYAKLFELSVSDDSEVMVLFDKLVASIPKRSVDLVSYSRKDRQHNGSDRFYQRILAEANNAPIASVSEVKKV